MGAIDPKQRIPDAAGFSYNFDREIYVNRKTKKIFSVDFIEDNDEKTLEGCIREGPTGKKWRSYFNDDPPDAVRRETVAVLS